MEDCPKCELFHCVCDVKDLPTFIVGKQTDNFVGIANEERDNNCFLSVVLQALLHVNCFVDMLHEDCVKNDRCAICCLKRVLFSMKNAKREKEKFIHIVEFRSMLNDIFRGRIFESGLQGDAMETIEILFYAIHNSSLKIFEEFELIQDEDCSEECAAHNTCFNRLKEIQKCRCQEKSTDNLSMSFILKIHSNWFYKVPDDGIAYQFNEVNYKEVKELYEYSEVKKLKETFSKVFKQKIKESLRQNQQERCQRCKEKFSYCLKLDSEPKMIIFQVAWENIFKVELYQILHFAISLQGKIRIDELFDQESDLEMGLQGLIVYLNGHYVYFTLGEDFYWYKIDDNLCHLVGAGRWYDVLVNLIYMKGIVVGLIYEELHIADLSLYRLEMLFLEKIVDYLYLNGSNEAGIMDTLYDYAVNPSKALNSSHNNEEIPCVYCEKNKKVGQICSYCGFDPKQTQWTCEACNRQNSGLNFMCDFCDGFRFNVPTQSTPCFTCHAEISNRICVKCDILFNCQNCRKPKTPFQSCFCARCKKPCRDGHCKDDQSDEMVCIECKDR
jgi:mRNA-degrading endonuclease RelE of RelBE toxin-antitoxin system